jgi:hypothetical protein
MLTEEVPMGVARVSGLCLLAAAVCIAPGCEDDEAYRDHSPPEGMGSIVVDNQTSDRVRVYIDGAYAAQAGDWDDVILDLDPGVYRVFLDGRDSDRTYQGDIDVLEGRLTILHVSPDSSVATAYRVRIEYEE